MFRGQLPPSSEFHITKTRDNPYRDRRFWSKQFSHASEVPAFLNDSCKLVFETGKAISFLKLIKKEVIKCTVFLYQYYIIYVNLERVFFFIDSFV
jgi:hypothetical protein